MVSVGNEEIKIMNKKMKMTEKQKEDDVDGEKKMKILVMEA